MTWQNRIDNIKFSIETGDGKTYFPLWKGGEKEKEFNTSSFNFINVYGTLVDRKKPQSGKFPLVFWFQGENNIEQADEFEASTDDPRAWTVTHPIYGEIQGQPISIKRDDSNLNVTEITIPFWESIDADYPLSNFTIKDNTMDRHRTLLYASSLSYVNNVKFASIDISKNSLGLQAMMGEMKGIQDENTYATFQNTFNQGLKAIDNMLSDPLSAIQSIQNFLDLPATYKQALDGRIASYENVYWRLKTSIKTLADKKYFESIGASLVSCMSLAMVLPSNNDFVVVNDVFNMKIRLNNIYNDYITSLDDLKVSKYDVANSFTPDASVQSELSSLIMYANDNLYHLAFEAKTERIIFTDKKTNIILLVHKYLGLDDNDDNIGIFIKTNDIKLNELFAIEKGREIRFSK